MSFQLKAPDTDEVYKPGDELLTKWGTKLPADQAANISYLLLRYGDTKKPDEAAALAHLLHSWTSAPRTPADLDASLPAAKIAYDAPFHLAGLPAGARAAVDRLKTEAETNRGPWTASVTKPDGDQHLGEPADVDGHREERQGQGRFRRPGEADRDRRDARRRTLLPPRGTRARRPPRRTSRSRRAPTAPCR